MIRDHFRVLHFDLTSGEQHFLELDGVQEYIGGSGLAALLYQRFAHTDRPWDDPLQPFILAIGPLTGLFPLMSKTVCAYTAPNHNQYAESHGGGRSALALRFIGVDAMVITGRVPQLNVLAVSDQGAELRAVEFMRGMDVFASGKLMRRMYGDSGHRSILRIGPAGENGSTMACINVESYRHFGRLGSGAVLGAKNLKGIVLLGSGHMPLPEGKAYATAYRKMYNLLTTTEMMQKYHNLGTAGNVAVLNAIQALPFRNLQQTSDPAALDLSGEALAEKTLLRNAACSGCPIGCIHIGFIREKFMEPNHFLYRQVSYDHEPVFAVGCMLAVTDPFAALDLMEEADKVGLDVMSAGVALAWATEATEKGLISAQETLVPLKFGDMPAYQQAMWHLARGENEFYRTLASGTLQAANRYGGADFACVLGQEMAGYATGETFFVSQAMGFRHSHLDSAGYSYDQLPDMVKDAGKAADYLIRDELGRAQLTSMVSCLFARKAYDENNLAECLDSVGYGAIAASLAQAGANIQRLRWQLRFAGGYAPEKVEIPKRFRKVVTWRGPIDNTYMDALMAVYGRKLRQLSGV